MKKAKEKSLSLPKKERVIESLLQALLLTLNEKEYSQSQLKAICEFVFLAYSKDSEFEHLSIENRVTEAYLSTNLDKYYTIEDVRDGVDIIIAATMLMFNNFESELWAFYISNKIAYIQAIEALQAPFVGDIGSDKYKAAIQGKKEAQEFCSLALDKDIEMRKKIEEGFGSISEIITKKRNEETSKSILEKHLEKIYSKNNENN